jgi:hypothetical protein
MLRVLEALQFSGIDSDKARVISEFQGDMNCMHLPQVTKNNSTNVYTKSRLTLFITPSSVGSDCRKCHYLFQILVPPITI